MVLDTFGSEPSSEEFDALRNEFLTRYGETLGTQTTLFPGMNSLLAQLQARNIAWGIVTNKPERFTTPLLRSLGVDAHCAAVICPEHVQTTKPDPEGLLKACAHIGCAPEQAVYVGDHGRDIAAGRNAGMFTVAVRYGYIPLGEQPEDWQADAVVEDVDAMVALLMPQRIPDV